MIHSSIPLKIGEKVVLKIIKENQPISIYELKKILEDYSYSGMFYYIKRLERRNKIKSELKIGENNRAVRLLSIVD